MSDNPKVYLIEAPKTLPSGARVTYYTLRWIGSTGRWQQKSIGRSRKTGGKITAKKAEEERREHEQKIGNGEALRDNPAKLTVSSFLKSDRDAIRTDVRPATLNVHKVASAHLLAVTGEGMLLSQVTWRHVARLKTRLTAEHEINGRTCRPCSRATVQKIIRTLKAAWYRAKRRRLVVANPFAEEKLGKQQSGKKRIFSHEEVATMVEMSELWWATFIRLAFTTGLRLGEILNLQWDDLTFPDEDGAKGVVAVTAKRAGTFTVGETTYPILEWSAKDHEERRLPLVADVAEMLARLRLKGGGSVYPFLSLERLAVLGRRREAGKLPEPAHWINNLGRDFNVIQKRARALLAKRRKVKVDEVEWRQGSPHDLRRSFGTHMAGRVAIHDLKSMMGHSSIQVTEQFYLDPDRDVAAKVRDVFSASA